MGGEVEAAMELTGEIAGVGEAAGGGDFVEGHGGGTEQFGGAVEAEGEQIGTEGEAGSLFKSAEKGGFGHGGDVGELGAGDRFGVVLFEVMEGAFELEEGKGLAGGGVASGVGAGEEDEEFAEEEDGEEAGGVGVGGKF